MKRFPGFLFGALFCIIASIGMQPAAAQLSDTTVFDPNDPVRVYDPGSQPQEPVDGEVGKWVKTNRVSWNSSLYKAYIYKGMPFRLMYPRNYDRTKKYPLYIFFHGNGEYGTVYDNEYQLYHGGELHRNAVQGGVFDGFLLYPQNQAGNWSSYYLSVVSQLVEAKCIPQLNIDPYRIYVNGLSAGGAAAWTFAIRYPRLVAALLPISATAAGDINFVNSYKFTPIWHFQGALDVSPTPTASRTLGNKILAAGGNYRYKEYPTRGHDCWYPAWNDKDYFPFMKRAHKANPWALAGRTEFCPGTAVNATIGVTAGFSGYEWRKDGVLIPGATTNQLTVTSLGTYDCRIKRGTEWSVWSPVPVAVKLKTVTVSPDIQVSGMASNAIPAPDGSTGVQLEVPENYASYNWQKDADTTILSTTRFLTTNVAGNYKVKVTEKFGCSSEFSQLFTVVNAKGTNGPAPVAGLIAAAASKTGIQLNWSQHASPAYNETGFEVYQATAAAGPYKLIQVTAADATGTSIDELNSNTRYFYKVRAVNRSAASDVAGPASALTLTDNTAPTAPENLRVTFITRSSVELLWNPASDDVSVTKYDLYIDGVKTYVTENTNYAVYNLIRNKTYTFAVKARDFTGNTSPFSNQVTATTIFTGLTYKYYEGVWNSLPDFNALQPVKTGTTRNVDLALKAKADSFAFLWEGYIRIPANGDYTFRTNSDDGSKLYIGPYSHGATALVNNDGLHGSQDRDGAITLNAGVYPIAITFFERSGGESMTVSWKTPFTGGNFVKIPDSVFAEAPVINGQPPLKPSNLKAIATSYKNIELRWNDNSTDESGFEILRSVHPSSGFVAITKTAANTILYNDTMVNPNTAYYYRIRAVNQFGESAFDRSEGNGVNYAYYETSGLSVLPDFSLLNPVKTGRASSFELGMENRSDNFQLKFDGFITLPASGTYTFYTASDDGSKLYIGGYSEANLVVNNDGLHGAQERSGTKTLAAGTYPITVTFFESAGGEVLSASISGPGLSKQAIPSSMLGSPYESAKTPPLPGTPAAPTNLLASATSAKSVAITWTDNGDGEDNYELYRSNNTNTNYTLIATLPSNSVSYQDTGLFSNSIFYYKVKAVNAGGGSASNEDSAKTSNNKPFITSIENQYIRFGTQLQLSLQATDADPESVTLQAFHLPSFGSFTAGPDGTGTLTFSPSTANQGTYTITVRAADQNNGLESTTFQLVVSDNHNPAVTDASNISMKENGTAQVTLTATDADPAAVFKWSFKGLPSFATLTTNEGVAQITFAPSYADANTYLIEARVQDEKNGFDTTSFILTVADVNVDKTLYINFNSTYNAGGVWNNLSMAPVAGAVRTGLKDDFGSNTTCGIKVLSDWSANGGAFATGTVTGTNSGVYPDVVMRTGWFAGKIEQAFQLTGLDPALIYNFKFFGSKAGSTTDHTTVYTINGISASLNTANNTSNTVSLNGIQPAADSTITIRIRNASTSANSYINAMVVEYGYDDGSLPLVPMNLVGAYQDRKVRLTWTDKAYNEDRYEVLRSVAENGTYVSIKSLGRNTAFFIDSTIQGNKAYYYKVQALNTKGTSGYSNVITVAVPNLAPVLNQLTDPSIKNDTTVTLNIIASDDPGEKVTISAANLPTFAALTDNGNGTAFLYLAPVADHVGLYKNVTITATDQNNGISTRTFTITVTNKDVTSVQVNFNAAMTTAQAVPWNNFNSTPAAGRTLTNLKDGSNLPTGINITLVDAWQSTGSTGAVTGNNSGVFPDNVLRTFYSESGTASKRIQLSGLSAAKRYNLTFIASRNVTGTVITNFTARGQTAALNAAGNTANLAKLNGLVPDSTGKIEVTIWKDASSSFAYINALVIDAYNSDLLLAPSSLVASAISSSAIKLTWRDNSSNETAYEVWRSLTAGGPYTLVATTPANVTSVTDGSLPGDRTFYYKVCAKSAAHASSYSNTARAATFAFSVYENINVDNPAPAPWNNTNRLPEQYAVFENLRNDQGNPSGISMKVVNSFSGFNPDGMNTGSNSGAVPDNVMRSSYYCGKGVTARLRIDGLSQVSQYNFVFFGSRNGSGDRTSVYTIGAESVSLNAAYNTANTVQISGVKPDENGVVYIDITHGPLSQFAYLNGLIIQAYSTAGAPDPENLRLAGPSSGINAALTQASSQLAQPIAEAEVSDKASLTVYPNPFVNEVTLQVPITNKILLLSVKITDISGRVISLQQFREVPAGIWRQRIALNSFGLKAGTYFIYIDGLPGVRPRMAKLLKIK